MKTMNDVLHFSNKLDFVAELENCEYKNFDCIKKNFTDDFQYDNSELLINMVGVIDDLHIFL